MSAAAAVAVPCSVSALVTAIQAANAVTSQVLQLAPFCTYSLTAPVVIGSRGPNGLPIITGNVTLVGQHRTTINRFSGARFRILEVAAGGTLTTHNLIISGGDGGANTGGGILNANGTVALNSTLIARNTADNGAGLSNDRGRMTLFNSIVSVNTTGGGGGGGGIYNDGILTLRRSTVSGNWANTSGGGIFNEQGGRTVLSSSTVSGNGAAANGGGIYNNAASTTGLQQSLIHNNSAHADGAGIYNRGTLQVVGSRLTANRATGNGGGTYNTPGATQLFHSTRLDRNTAASGGGIYNGGGLRSVALNSTTITGNVVGNCRPLGSIQRCVG
ncbi:hypothetical protein ACRYCC_10075 [Actinomadura scrupuli]